MSFQELLELTQRFAYGLASIGVVPGDHVALVLPNGVPFVVGFLAIAGLGAIAVTLDPQSSEDELARSFRQGRLRAILAEPRHRDMCRRVTSEWPQPVGIITTDPRSNGGLSFRSLMHDSQASPLSVRPPDEEVLCQSSSGSTGRPKWVTRTQQQCLSEAENFTWTTQLMSHDIIFCMIPLFHAHGLGNCLFAAMHSGATLVILDDPQPFVLTRQRALELLQRSRATVLPGTPLLFRLLSEIEDPADLSTLRLCFSAGSRLPRSIFEAFDRRFGTPIRQLYGCTEAGSVTMNLDPDPRTSADSVGRPIRRVDVKIINSSGQGLPPGRVGQIAIRSPAMTRGYRDLEEVNRQVFRDGWFLPGDFGRCDEEGRLYVTGRTLSVIEVAGHKVDPLEVEDILMTHPDVREAVIVGAKGVIEGEELIKAVVVPRAPCREEDLIEFCRQRLSRFKVPQVVEFRETIPKSSTGKVLREELA